MEMARLTIGVFETEPALAEIDFAGDASVHHPLQRAIDGGAADALIFAADEIHEIIRTQVTFLAQEHVDDLFPLAGPLAAVRLEPAEIRKVAIHRGVRQQERRGPSRSAAATR